MKIFSLQAAAAAVLAMTMVLVDARSMIANCLSFFELNDSNQCVPIPLLQTALNKARVVKRAASTPCPYCAGSIWDVYPNWDDCSKFYYCLNGTNVELSCKDLGHLYFNPTTKYCEDIPSNTNSCLFRTFSLLNYIPPASG